MNSIGVGEEGKRVRVGVKDATSLDFPQSSF
jgi:hypothetical protein